MKADWYDVYLADKRKEECRLGHIIKNRIGSPPLLVNERPKTYRDKNGETKETKNIRREQKDKEMRNLVDSMLDDLLALD